MNRFEMAGEMLEKNIVNLTNAELATLTEITHKFQTNWNTIRNEWENRSKGNPMSALTQDGKQIDISYRDTETAKYDTCATLLTKKDLNHITKFSVDMKAVKAVKDIYKQLVEGGAIATKTSIVVAVED